MAHSFSLSLAAVDILLEYARLGRAPFPFEVPHIGTTHTQRAQVREAVFRDLDGRGLLRGGALDPDARAALETFVNGPVAVTAAARLGETERLFARSAVSGEFGVVARQDGNLMVFEQVRPASVVSAIVDLLPSAKPGPGQSVTVAKPQAPRPARGSDEGSYDPFAGASRARSQSAPQLRTVERLFEKPKLRIGQFTVFMRGNDGKQRNLTPVVWFDTEDGRYFCTQRAAEDGQQWLTYAPADNARITQHLRSQSEQLRNS